MRAAIVYDCISPIHNGGGERVYRALAESLVADGWEVEYVTRDAWSPGAPPPAPFAVTGVWSGAIHDANGSRLSSSALAFALAVRRHLRRHRREYDVVIASALPVLTLLAARLGVGRRTRLIGDWLEVWPLRRWWSYAGPGSGTTAWLLQWLAARSTQLHTVNSRFTAERLRAVRRRLEPEVLDLVALAPPAEVQAPATPPYALAIGRLIPDKRFELLPAALADARRRIPELRLVVVGKGPTAPRILAAAAESGVAEAVDLVGSVTESELAQLRARASVLVHPSLREGFGLVVVEAISQGVPAVVISGPDNAAAELVHSDENGVRLRDENPGALADAIVRVVEGGDDLRARTARSHLDRFKATTLAAGVRRLLNAS